MLHNFGRVHSLPHTKKLTDYQVNFVADRPAKSFITVSMVADDMRVVVHKSPGRIVESYIEAFEALSTTGELVALVQNIGKYTATYNVRVCMRIKYVIIFNFIIIVFRCMFFTVQLVLTWFPLMW